MKKLLLSLLALIAVAVGASAQQIQLGYGGFTQMDNSDMHADAGKINNAWGALTAGVNFNVMPKLKLGVSYTFSSASFKKWDGNAYYHVLMANAYYRYYSNSIVRLYGHLGIGADITHVSDIDETKGYFAFQISPLGAEVGLSPKTAIFAELGYGAQGLLQAGVRFNL
ncbi:MAG: porin family protein [Duncaniella sp.]|nr:porin family protein [Duncaniella sp.]